MSISGRGIYPAVDSTGKVRANHLVRSQVAALSGFPFTPFDVEWSGGETHSTRQPQSELDDFARTLFNVHGKF